MSSNLLLIKNNIPSSYFDNTPNTCTNDISFTQMEYNNPGINKWVGSIYINDYMKLATRTNLGMDTSYNVYNNCMSTDKISNLPSNSPSMLKLSQNNINLLSPCEFKDNINPQSNLPCLETMQNLNETNQTMSFSDKGYLISFSLIIVGLLFKANYRLTHM